MDYDYGNETMSFDSTTEQGNNTNYNTEGENNMNNNTFNGEVVVEDMNGNTIQTTEEKTLTFERVDLTDMMSILNYGGEVIERFTKSRESLYTYDNNGDKRIGEVNQQIQEKMDAIVNFDEDLKEQEEKQKKIDERSKKLGGRILNKIIGKAMLVGQDTYAEVEEKHAVIIQDLVNIVDENGLRATEAFMANAQYLEELEKIIAELGEVKNIGKQDLDKFEKQIELKKQQGPLDGEDEVLFDVQIQKAEAQIQEMKEQLAEIGSVKVVAGETYSKTLVTQGTYKEAMKIYAKTKKFSVPILEFIARDALDTRNAKELLSTSKTINDGVNKAMQKNSKQALENAQEALSQTEKGIIYIDTIKAYSKDMAEAKKAFEQHGQKMARAIETRNQVNAQLEATCKSTVTSLKKFVNYKENDTELLKGMQLPELPETSQNNNPKTKKLGTAPTNGNK